MVAGEARDDSVLAARASDLSYKGGLVMTAKTQEGAEGWSLARLGMTAKAKAKADSSLTLGMTTGGGDAC